MYTRKSQTGRGIEKQIMLGKINELTFNPRFKRIMAERLLKPLRKYN